MSLSLDLDLLLAYTDWERGQWRAWFRTHGSTPLGIGTGPHGDGRFGTVGDLIRHIFSAEARYVDRLTGRPLTDPATVPAGDPDALFAFGDRSRAALRAFIAGWPPERWEVSETLEMGPHRLSATPRKIVLHVVLHEIRHWAQVATLLRLQGLTHELSDFLFSPVLDRPAP